MIVGYANDGQKVDRDKLLSSGFAINEARDLRKRNAMEVSDSVLNFVGFLVNENNDIFTVFPKNYKPENLEVDSFRLFSAISMHLQKRPEIYLGSEYGDKLQSNYPFAAFFGIYDYYVKYGLFSLDITFVKPNIGGKINWKETIRLSDKYLSGGKLSFCPLYYDKKYYFSALLTECMVFAIDYTLEKFGLFIGMGKTGRPFPEYDFLNNREGIVHYLHGLRQQVFRDSIIQLIDNLLAFFSDLKEGGSYYFKHYSFSSVWEHMVMEYLQGNYKEVKDYQLVFDKEKPKSVAFSKPTFYPNLANNAHFFSPDYYYLEGKTQLIFDAKYYTEIHGMDYKQIAYYLFLNEYREKTCEEPVFDTTYSALLLPAEKRHSKIHFAMDPLFNKSNANLIISEEYLDIREVLEFYLTK